MACSHVFTPTRWGGAPLVVVVVVFLLLVVVLLLLLLLLLVVVVVVLLMDEDEEEEVGVVACPNNEARMVVGVLHAADARRSSGRVVTWALRGDRTPSCRAGANIPRKEAPLVAGDSNAIAVSSRLLLLLLLYMLLLLLCVLLFALVDGVQRHVLV